MSFERRLPSSERSFLGRRVHVKNSWRVLRVPIGKSGIHFTQWTVVSTRPFLGKTTRALTRSVLTMPRTVGCATSVKYAVFTTAYQPNQSRQVARPEERTVFQSAPKGAVLPAQGDALGNHVAIQTKSALRANGSPFSLRRRPRKLSANGNGWPVGPKGARRWRHDSPGRCPGLGEPKAFGPGNIRCFTEENWHTTKPL